MRQSVMRAFNNGRPLTVVRVSSQWEGDTDKLGVVDEEGLKVWMERDLSSSRVSDFRSLEVVQLPSFPANYGKWKRTSIGGVSRTVRRYNVIRAGTKTVGPITVFAIQCPTNESIAAMFESEDCCSVGDSQWVDDRHGIVTEIIVYDPEELAHVCALVAKTGATVMLEDASVNAHRCLGVERLDRIGAEVVCKDNMYEENDGVYGLRRGNDNWKFVFLPDNWRVPITWDHMVDNVLHEPLTDIPQPLRQHVARRRLTLGMYDRIGTRWTATVPPTEEELKTPSPPELRTVLHFPSKDLVEWIQKQNEGIECGSLPITVKDDITVKSLVQVDGTWYRPVDTTRFLKKHLGDFGKRYVSAALKDEQSEQLLTAFYYLCIERRQSAEVNHAFILIMYHYMKERGYTARWIGKYEQEAHHIGNGDVFRNFNRLAAYAPHRLPAEVLNKLCGTDGKLHSRGSKGSRSKYRSDKQRYVPRRRLKRSRDDEDQMACPSVVATS